MPAGSSFQLLAKKLMPAKKAFLSKLVSAPSGDLSATHSNSQQQFSSKTTDRTTQEVRGLHLLRPPNLEDLKLGKEWKFPTPSLSDSLRDKIDLPMLTVADRHEEVKDCITNAKKHAIGLGQWRRFSALNQYLQGLREGELTLLTGPTGMGKTTFVCEYALDLCVGSQRVICRKPLWQDCWHSETEHYLRDFMTSGQMLFFPTDSLDVDDPELILDMIRRQSEERGVRHVVIDNLQYMLGAAGVSGMNERFAAQDRLVARIRRLANDTKTHVTLVVHPRKEVSGSCLTLSSLYGGVRLSQDADNVLLIQRSRAMVDGERAKYLHIGKNRDSGARVENDRLQMTFDKCTLCHTIVDSEPGQDS